MARLAAIIAAPRWGRLRNCATVRPRSSQVPRAHLRNRLLAYAEWRPRLTVKPADDFHSPTTTSPRTWTRAAQRRSLDVSFFVGGAWAAFTWCKHQRH